MTSPQQAMRMMSPQQAMRMTSPQQAMSIKTECTKVKVFLVEKLDRHITSQSQRFYLLVQFKSCFHRRSFQIGFRLKVYRKKLLERNLVGKQIYSLP